MLISVECYSIAENTEVQVRRIQDTNLSQFCHGLMWNVILSGQKCITFVYSVEYYFNGVKVCHFGLCCICLIM